MNYQVRSAGIRRQFSGENALLAAIRYARNLAQAASVHRLEPASNKLGYTAIWLGPTTWRVANRRMVGR